MNPGSAHPQPDPEWMQGLGHDFGLKRRCFVQILGATLMVAVGSPALGQAQRNPGRGRSGGTPRNLSARIHVEQDGRFTVYTGKVEGGQGARAELSQAAAEELRVAPDRIRMVMADTAQTPDDGITAGSRTTPSTVPAVRQAAAALRELLASTAAKKWNLERGAVQIKDGRALASESRELSYDQLGRDPELARTLDQPIDENAPLTPVENWSALGGRHPRPNGRDLVTGSHKFPSDMTLPGMLYGKVLRPDSYSARLRSVDLAPAKAMPGVVAVHDDQFVGVAAPTSFAARQALDAVARTARWEHATHTSSKELFTWLRQNSDPSAAESPFKEQLSGAKQTLRATYEVAYVQHAPLEPRAALARWEGDTLTVWMGTQSPFGCRGELARAFHLSEEKVRVIVPDFGSGFGGKHTAEAGIEAARLARTAQRPVSLVWTRKEEFTWAYFRPAALIDIQASLDEKGALTSWYFLNINSGPASIDTPYRAGQARSRFVNSKPPLRQGSYRALAATANNFAREAFMDELAAAAGRDPLAFRLAHLDNPRLRAVLETAAKRFNWQESYGQKTPNKGVGFACGTEKGSYVAACVEVEILPPENRIVVKRVYEVFECGKVLNPPNLRSQVEGQIIMALGPALREQILFEKGEIQNASFRNYQVPRFSDVPELDIDLLDRPDLSPAGGGETPIIAVAPAIANAVFHATGTRVRTMPIKLPAKA